MRKFFILSLLLITFILPNATILAQTEPAGPVYVVQSGDSLYSIALRFGITVNDLIDANQLADPNALAAGMELTIPGLVGVSGRLLTETIPLGVDLNSLAHYRGIDPAFIIKLNRITSPAEVYAGSNLILPDSGASNNRKAIKPLAGDSSLLLNAALSSANPMEIALINQNNLQSMISPGEQLFVATQEETPPPNPLSPLVQDIQFDPLPLVQGQTEVLRVRSTSPITLTGKLNGYELHFMPAGENEYIALQGIHAMAEPGLAPFSLTVTDENGAVASFEQMMLLQQGYYAQDPPLYVDPETIDPANTKPEDDRVRQATIPVSPTKYWDGIFRLPVDEPYCIKSWYGNRRSYNNSPFSYFHTGLDYGVCANLNIYAPAPGVVVLADFLTVRGNATIIDHGWGVYSGIWHQQSINVKVGDRVEAGDLIGEIGGTGRVTGPHLHWEVWVNGVQVEPQTWLDRPFP